MAKRKLPKMTAEELAERAKTQRMVEERIAYHHAKAIELGEVPAGAARPETQQLVKDRIAYHAAKAREEEARRTQSDG